MDKVLLRPDRQRQLPRQFSWLDQRLVRQRYLEQASSESWLLYLFLLSVADAQGLSFYAERTLCERLRLNAEQLAAARGQLLNLELIAYRRPLYQVLALSPTPPWSSSSAVRPEPGQLAHHLQQLRQALRRHGGA